MEVSKKHKDDRPAELIEVPAWQPEVLEGVSGSCDLPADFDLDEVWHWFHARLKALGELSYDDARLTALLNWNETTVGDALRAARLQDKDLDAEDTAMRAHLEFLTAEFMARHTLEEETIPAPELRPA